MPTDRPRYTVTDVGPVAEALDYAAERWPEQKRGPDLLRALLADVAEGAGRASRVERQRRAARALAELLDADALLSDEAWR